MNNYFCELIIKLNDLCENGVYVDCFCCSDVIWSSAVISELQVMG